MLTSLSVKKFYILLFLVNFLLFIIFLPSGPELLFAVIIWILMAISDIVIISFYHAGKVEIKNVPGYSQKELNLNIFKNINILSQVVSILSFIVYAIFSFIVITELANKKTENYSLEIMLCVSILFIIFDVFFVYLAAKQKRLIKDNNFLFTKFNKWLVSYLVFSIIMSIVCVMLILRMV